MKLGGITWWRNNYGSILQAYALQKFLREDMKQDYVIINQYSGKMMSVDNLVDKLKTIGIKNTVKRLVGRFGLPKLRKRVEALQKFVDNNLIVSNKVYSEDNIDQANDIFDGFLCGSDQIWNPANVALDSMYWLCFAKPGKIKIAYAPSIGLSEADKEQKNRIRENLKSFNAISSREESGKRLINQILDSDVCQTVLDPTLIVERELWDNLSNNNNIGEKYIFAYLLRGTVQERKRIERFAKQKNMRIVSMPFLDGENLVLYDFKFGDIKLWSSGPDDFIRAIRYAEYVFTDSFHCMVFSCIYHKTFFTFPKKGKMQMSRIEGLQELLGVGSRIITDEITDEKLDAMLEIDWRIVDSNIGKYRDESRQFLRNAIRKGDKNAIN